MKESNYKELKYFCVSNGASLFGVADISTEKDNFLIPKDLIKNLSYGISIGVKLSKTILEEIVDHPTNMYFYHYKSVNNLLDHIALKLTNYIEAKDHKALPIPVSQIIDWKTQAASLNHRAIAYLAGLGFWGRSNLLVNPKFGSQFRLVTILTDMPLLTDKPTGGNCGSCFACIDVCPAKAIDNDSKKFNKTACREKLKDFTRQNFTQQYICGVCVKACKGK